MRDNRSMILDDLWIHDCGHEVCSAVNHSGVVGRKLVVRSFMCLLFLSVQGRNLKLCMCLGIAAVRMMFHI